MTETTSAPSSAPRQSPQNNEGQAQLPDRRASQQELHTKNEELRKLIDERVQGRMHTLGLRSGERNSLINQLYGAFLESKPGELLFDSLDQINKAIADAQKLTALADLIEGKQQFSPELAALSVNQLQAYLDTTYKRGQQDDFDRELDPASVLLEALKAAKLDKLPADKTFKEIWEQGLPTPTLGSMGPGGFSSNHVIAATTKTISAEELIANGPSALMMTLADAGADRARRIPFRGRTGKCATYVRSSFGDANITNGQSYGGSAKDYISALQNHKNFALVTGVTPDMLNRLPEGCVIVHKKAADLSWHGHICITLDPAKSGGFTAVSHIFQRNRLVYNPADLHVFIPVGTV